MTPDTRHEHRTDPGPVLEPVAITPGRYRRPGFTAIEVLAVVDVPGLGRLICYVSAGGQYARRLVRRYDLPVWTEWEDETRYWERPPWVPAAPATSPEAAGRRLAELYAAGDARSLTTEELAEVRTLGDQLPDLSPEVLRALGVPATPAAQGAPECACVVL